MTAREIAAIANVSARTARRVAARLFPGKSAQGHRTTYARDEAVTIMAELRKPGFIAPSTNVDKMAKRGGQTVQVAKLPAGNQLHELRMIYGPAEAARRLDAILGYERTPPRAVSTPIVGWASPGNQRVDFGLLLEVAERGPTQRELDLEARR